MSDNPALDFMQTNNVNNNNKKNSNNTNDNNNTLSQTSQCNRMQNCDTDCIYTPCTLNNPINSTVTIVDTKNTVINNNEHSNATLASTSTVNEVLSNVGKKNAISSILRNSKKLPSKDHRVEQKQVINDVKRSLPANITFVPAANALLPQPTTVADRFVQQHHPHIHNQNQQQRFLPRVKPQFRKLKKYASETCFSATSAPHIGTDFTMYSSATNSSETPSSPSINTNKGYGEGFSSTEATLEPLLSGENLSSQNKSPNSPHLFQVREVKNFNCGSTPNYRFFAPNMNNSNNNISTNVCSSGATVINKINRKRQDSDDASGSLGSETTVASGTMSPQSRKNMRFKMRRPRSTGNVVQMTSGNSQQNSHLRYTIHNNNHVSGRHPHYSGSSGGGFDHTTYYNQNQQNNYATNNSGNYDTSFTSATLHSLDDSFHHVHADTYSNGAPSACPGADDRRPSNFYLFENDSNHEFDDEINGNFIIFFN